MYFFAQYSYESKLHLETASKHIAELLFAQEDTFTNAQDQYLLLVKVPMTFVQLELSPPHTPHLSYWSFEPMMPSQPVRMHFPRTQIELLYGRHSVPSVT